MPKSNSQIYEAVKNLSLILILKGFTAEEGLKVFKCGVVVLESTLKPELSDAEVEQKLKDKGILNG